jgi:hypothetical protein
MVRLIVNSHTQAGFDASKQLRPATLTIVSRDRAGGGWTLSWCGIMPSTSPACSFSKSAAQRQAVSAQAIGKI